MNRIALLGSLLLALTSFAQDATYTIEFISNWSSTTHPMDYPSGSAHWSPLIGASHKDAALAFDLGVIASNGIESVAETGATGTIMGEINVLIAAGVADKVISGSGLGTGPGTITINNVQVDADFPFISLMTMIAPSPDWIAMIGNQKLTDTNGNWINSISVDVYATDAGTDSGSTYTSLNADITPHIEMQSLQNVAPFSNEIIGTFVFTLEQVLSTPSDRLNAAISLYPNPTKEILTLKNDGNLSIERAELYTVNGKRIQTINNIGRIESISLQNLNRGLYFLRIFSDQGSLTKKLILE